ncbi:uncharacterized protein LOC110408425 [Numida meleagris]|uniref:uncharacterized protein LOC110408425 n=1 Tax=Numida meleagris TaxID=8996 RepID=UPI000B3DF374|nr:uncharacterized protein LOC110408425 [Numida meleagris]XP_021272757.1 uncharacterized protein LOC110408425 [Numida meleagris]
MSHPEWGPVGASQKAPALHRQGAMGLPSIFTFIKASQEEVHLLWLQGWAAFPTQCVATWGGWGGTEPHVTLGNLGRDAWVGIMLAEGSSVGDLLTLFISLLPAFRTQLVRSATNQPATRAGAQVFFRGELTPRAGELPAAGLCPSSQHLLPVRLSGAARCRPASGECRSALWGCSTGQQELPQHGAAPSCIPHPQPERRGAEPPPVLRRFRFHRCSVAFPTDVTFIAVALYPARRFVPGVYSVCRLVRFSHPGAWGQWVATVLKRWVPVPPLCPQLFPGCPRGPATPLHPTCCWHTRSCPGKVDQDCSPQLSFPNQPLVSLPSRHLPDLSPPLQIPRVVRCLLGASSTFQVELIASPDASHFLLM